MYWVDVQLAQRKGFKFYQTRSDAIILYDALPAFCFPKVVVMESGSVTYEKVYVSPRPPPMISFKDNWIKELDSEVAGVCEDSQLKEAEHLGLQELVKKIEIHLHREALQADMQQNNVHNPCSNNSKEMIRDLGSVELLELCETTQKVQCSQCLHHWNQGIMHCTCGQFLVDSKTRRKFSKLRLDAFSPELRDKERAQSWCSKPKSKKSTI